MQKIIKPLFPIVLSAICVFFALQLLFGISEIPNLIFDYTNTSSPPLYMELQSPTEKELPYLKFAGGSLTVGESVYFPSLFVLCYPDGSEITIDNDAKTNLYLLDVTDLAKVSQISFINSSKEGTITEIPSDVVFDRESSKLTFYKSGIYTVYFRMYFENHPGKLYECNIPVEVN